MVIQALDIDHEPVRVLAIAIGVRPAARQMGLNEDTVCAWAAREGWLETPKPPATMQPRASNASSTAAEALANVMQEHDRETRLSLARAARRNAAEAEEAGLEGADKALATGKLAALTHGWATKAQVDIRLGVFSASGEVQASAIEIDVESQ